MKRFCKQTQDGYDNMKISNIHLSNMNQHFFTCILENGYLLLHWGHRSPELSLLIDWDWPWGVQILLTSRAHWGQSARWTQGEEKSEWQKTVLLVTARLPLKRQFFVTHTSMKKLVSLPPFLFVNLSSSAAVACSVRVLNALLCCNSFAQQRRSLLSCRNQHLSVTWVPEKHWQTLRTIEAGPGDCCIPGTPCSSKGKVIGSCYNRLSVARSQLEWPLGATKVVTGLKHTLDLRVISSICEWANPK